MTYWGRGSKHAAMKLFSKALLSGKIFIIVICGERRALPDIHIEPKCSPLSLKRTISSVYG